MKHQSIGISKFQDSINKDSLYHNYRVILDGKISINKIDLTDFENRHLTNEDKIKILNTIEQLTRLLKENL
jgi:hypothetical protein